MKLKAEEVRGLPEGTRICVMRHDRRLGWTRNPYTVQIRDGRKVLVSDCKSFPHTAEITEADERHFYARWL